MCFLVSCSTMSFHCRKDEGNNRIVRKIISGSCNIVNIIIVTELESGVIDQNLLGQCAIV